MRKRASLGSAWSAPRLVDGTSVCSISGLVAEAYAHGCQRYVSVSVVTSQTQSLSSQCLVTTRPNAHHSCLWWLPIVCIMHAVQLLLLIHHPRHDHLLQIMLARVPTPCS